MTDVVTPAPVSLWRLFLRMGGWIPLILFGMLLLLTLISSAELRMAQRFAEEGEEATAIVRDKYTRETRDSDGNRKTTYYLTLGFETRAGSLVEVSPSVARTRFSAMELGQSMQIWYLQSEPERIETIQGSHENGAKAAQYIGLVLGVGGLIGLWICGGRAVAATRARRFGTRVDARVTDHVATRYKVNKQHRFRLAWRDANGVEGSSLPQKKEALIDHPVGSTIQVYQGIKRGWWVGDVGTRPDP